MLSLTEIILSGTPYERGFQHGSQLGSQIRLFLNDQRARIHSVRVEPMSDELIDQLVQEHTVVIEAALPDIAEELRGLAAGANISYPDAVLLQLRMELISYRHLENMAGDCSTIAFRQSGHQIVTAQTIDLPGNLSELGYVFRVLPQHKEDPSILLYGFAGLLGYMGMNSFGVSVNINMVLSEDWQPGVPPYLLVRHLLTLRNVAECLQALDRITRASSRSFIITDPQQLVNIELTGKRSHTIAADCLLHTNHYLHPDLQTADAIHFLFKNSSIQRLNRLKALLSDNLSEVSPEMLMEWMADHSLYPVGICAHSEGNIRRSETVAAVVMQPGLFTMHARKGTPCSAITQTFKLDKSRAPERASVQEIL